MTMKPSRASSLHSGTAKLVRPPSRSTSARERVLPKPAEPEPNRLMRSGQTNPSAMQANLDDPPIHIRPICSRRRGFEGQEPNGFSACQHSDNRTEQPRPPPDSSQLLSRVSS